MMLSKRSAGVAGLLLVLAFAAGLALLILSGRSEPVDHSPVVKPSALRDWTPKWSQPADDPEAAQLEEAQNPVSADGLDAAVDEGAEENGAEENGAQVDTDDTSASEESRQAALDGCADMPERWLVIGWDGADWDLLLPMIEAGKLPHFESLMRGGSYGTLYSIIPTISPAIWTTMVTGVAPERHGILHFYNQKPPLQRLIERAKNFGELKRQLYSNADRREPAIWNELSSRDREVLLVGYHNTFPVEKVHGVMVSNYLMQDSVADVMDMDVEGDDGSALGASLVYPPEHLQEVLDTQRRVKRRTPEMVKRFANIPEDELDRFLRLSQRLDVEDQKPYYLVHSWLFDTIAAETAEAFLSRSQPDLAMVHFQAVDWVAHRFYYFHDPELFTDMDWSPEIRSQLDAELPRYQNTLEEFYVYLDEWLGRLVALRSPGTAVMLLSDHGFEPDSDPVIPGAHEDAPPGVIVVNGPGIKRGHHLAPTDVYDIMPTLMAGLQAPVAEDLSGSPIQEAFCSAAWQSAQHQTVASYSTGQPFSPEIMRSESLDAEVLEQLESLGYLD